HRHTAFGLAQDRKNSGFAISRHLHQNLLRYLAEKILLPHPLSFGEDYPDEAATKLIYLAIRSFEKIGRCVREWVAARNQFAILYTEGFNR
ncbi:MAG: hypothetical protein ACJAQW_001829, partial [Paracoccaceae bacterium]